MSDFTLEDYRKAPSGIGPLAAEWADKPHRLLYDLINKLTPPPRTPETNPLTPILARLDFLHRTIAGRPDSLQEWEKHVQDWRKEINEAWPAIRDSLDIGAIEVEIETLALREAADQRVTKLESQIATPDLAAILIAIENYCGDDFSEDLDMQDAAGPLEGPLKEAHTRLSEIYKLAHAFNPSHSCYSVHQNWRDKLNKDITP